MALADYHVFTTWPSDFVVGCNVVTNSLYFMYGSYGCSCSVPTSIFQVPSLTFRWLCLYLLPDGSPRFRGFFSVFMTAFVLRQVVVGLSLNLLRAQDQQRRSSIVTFKSSIQSLCHDKRLHSQVWFQIETKFVYFCNTSKILVGPLIALVKK